MGREVRGRIFKIHVSFNWKISPIRLRRRETECPFRPALANTEHV